MDLKRELEANLLLLFRQGLRETQALKDNEIEELLSMVGNKTVKRRRVLAALTRQEEPQR